MTASNLRKVFVDALPFYPAELISNILYSYVLFALHCVLFRRRTDISDLDSNERDEDVGYIGIYDGEHSEYRREKIQAL